MVRWYDAFTGKPTGLGNPNRTTVPPEEWPEPPRCGDALWAGTICELLSGHEGNHVGTATARDNGETRAVEWEG